MSAIKEARRMASLGGVSMDIMTMVLRMNFSTDEIRQAYDTIIDEFDIVAEKQNLLFYPRSNHE